MQIRIPQNPMYSITGIEPKTTFWQDFSIADVFGADAIRDTYSRAFKAWKDNVEYLTEMVLVLNWKIWQFYQDGNQSYAKLYNELYSKANDYALDNLKGDDLTYFFQMTD